jgi:glucose-6-phosphate dehydrogenase assembly protein OpcA
MTMAALEPEQILRELHELWERLDHDAPGGGGVLRACAMTLAVAAQNEEDAAQARRTIGAIMHDHPCRALVLNTERQGPGVAARVFSECWIPLGGQEQICSEGVEIQASADHFAEVARLWVSLRAPDLPMVVWCRGGDAFSLRAYDALFPFADKLILDSSTVASARGALAFLRRLRARGRRVADLEWTRLTGWRENLAHLFEDQKLDPEQVTSARVAYGGTAPSAGALYFASWIGHALPRAHVRLEPGGGDAGLCEVALSADGRESSLALANPGCLKGRVAGNEYLTSLLNRDEVALMREELKILGADPAYEAALG